MRIEKWEDSLVVRLPAETVEAMKLGEGDEVEITILRSREPDTLSKADRKTLLDRIAQYGSRMPADFVFDREEANSR